MRSLNLDQLQAFATVTELASFTAAARRLNLSQSTISVQIRELERKLGVKLIERMGKQAHLTPPGQELLEAAQRIFRECQVAETTMRRYREGWIGHVHVGTTNTALTYDLPPVLRRLRRDHPGIDLHVTNMSTRESVEKVMQNDIDLSLITLPIDKRHLRVTPLRAQVLVAIFPRTMRDLPDEVTPDYVAQHTLLMEHAGGAVHALIMRWLGAVAPLPRAPMHLGTIDALKSAVGSELGMSIIPDVAARNDPNIVVRPLHPAMPCTLALIEHRNKPNTPALEIVRNALLDLREDNAFRSRHGVIGRRRRGSGEEIQPE